MDVAQMCLNVQRTLQCFVEFYLSVFILVIYFLGVQFLPFSVEAEESTVCAQVKIEIQQELALERQAFDAVMRISNGMVALSIENVEINIVFEDELGDGVLASSDPDNTQAKFFIKLDQLSNITAVDGTDSISPETTAEVHWLIIPSLNASDGFALGKLYFVGATLSYTLAGVLEEVEVTPDFITVKPLPKLSLDYFLTKDVVGDDPTTAEIEAVEPYTLGVRVKNNGLVPAVNVRIESAQPTIVENEQGLLIDFDIVGSTIDNEPSPAVLLVDFGEIAAGRSRVGRWQMTSSLAGEFKDFSASFTHADELGGDLTSLIEAVDVHFLVGNVIVDLFGRDEITDFLAVDGSTYRVFESDGTETIVTDQSSAAQFQLLANTSVETEIKIDFPATSGFVYARIPDPYEGKQAITLATRLDGKNIPMDNAWLSKSRNRQTVPASWDYFINLFDVDSTGQYVFQLKNQGIEPVPPTLQFISDRQVFVNSQVGFLIESSDLNDDLIFLSASPVPEGASFIDNSDGTGFFTWTPTSQQRGVYVITYSASDNTGLSVSQTARIIVGDAEDSDFDGMNDDWELSHFGSLLRDGSGDLDGDGIFDLQEYLDGSNPEVGSGITIPHIDLPLSGAHVGVVTPDLVISNSLHKAPFDVTYEYRIYSDASYTNLVASLSGIAETPDNTSVMLDVPLDDNTWYYWRVRAYDGHIYSRWSNARFFVNTLNDAPTEALQEYPPNGLVLSSLTPIFTALKSIDIDGDDLAYRFEIFEDANATQLVAIVKAYAGDYIVKGQVQTPLIDGHDYYWRSVVVDDHNVEKKTALSLFSIDRGLAYIYPRKAYADKQIVTSDVATLKITAPTAFTFTAIYPYGATCEFEIDTSLRFDSTNKKSSGQIPCFFNHSWTVDGLIDNQQYYWRARLMIGEVSDLWTHASLYVNSDNSPPEIPIPSNVGQLSWAESDHPVLSVYPVNDVDGNGARYYFELYADADMGTLIAEYNTLVPSWNLPSNIVLQDVAFWRVRAEDFFGSSSNWSLIFSTLVNDNSVDDIPFIKLTNISLKENFANIEWLDDDPDSSASVSFYYSSQSGENTPIVQAIDEDTDAGLYTWDTTWLPENNYQIYGIIEDNVSSISSYYPDVIPLGNKDKIISLSGVSAEFPDLVADLKINLTRKAVYFNSTIVEELKAYDKQVLWQETELDGVTTIRIRVLRKGDSRIVLRFSFQMKNGQVVLPFDVSHDDLNKRILSFSLQASGAQGEYVGVDQGTSEQVYIQFSLDSPTVHIDLPRYGEFDLNGAWGTEPFSNNQVFNYYDQVNNVSYRLTKYLLAAPYNGSTEIYILNIYEGGFHFRHVLDEWRRINDPVMKYYINQVDWVTPGVN